MDGNSGLPMVGFDSRLFWQEANAVLARGTREMLINAKDKEAFLSAFDKMDNALGEIVERLNPPEQEREDLNTKLSKRTELVKEIMKARGIDANKYWEAEMKSVAMIVLKALGKTRKEVFRIDNLVGDAANALCEGNFTRDGAKRLMAELSAYNCKDLRQLLSKLEDTPSHMDFLRLLCENGTKKSKSMAETTMACLLPNAMPEKRRMQYANVIQMPMLAVVRAPLRHA